jgi:hypothetical protein
MSKRSMSWFAALLALALPSRIGVRVAATERCALDGAAIEPIRRVDLMQELAVRASFCSIACAREWPERPAGSFWQVRDEISGRPIDAERATFVLSRVVSVPARGERLHVFRNVADATAHCEQFGGTVVVDPLAALPPEPPRHD